MKINNNFFENLSIEKRNIISKLKTEKTPTYIFGEGEYSTIVSKFLIENQINILNNFTLNGYDLFYNGNQFDFINEPFNLVIGIADETKARNLISRFNSKLINCTGIHYFALNPFYNLNKEIIIANLEKLNLVLSMLNDYDSKMIFSNYLKSAVTFSNEYLSNTMPQYFPSFFQLTDKEIVVDGGAYIGDTLNDYLRIHKSFLQYHAFEPSMHNFVELSKNKISNNLFVYNKGLGLSNQNLLFHDGVESSTTSSFVSSTFNSNNLMEVQIVRLDDIISEVTFIKLDIEGAELDALIGSAHLISVCKPKIAVCVYHKFEHLWQIIDFLKSLRSDYKFSIRYHSLSNILTELVLYAY
jgi:FkbM family methyltransferase